MGVKGGGGCTPLPTHPRRYCNPALLFHFLILLYVETLLRILHHGILLGPEEKIIDKRKERNKEEEEDEMEFVVE